MGRCAAYPLYTSSRFDIFPCTFDPGGPCSIQPRHNLFILRHKALYMASRRRKQCKDDNPLESMSHVMDTTATVATTAMGIGAMTSITGNVLKNLK